MAKFLIQILSGVLSISLAVSPAFAAPRNSEFLRRKRSNELNSQIKLLEAAQTPEQYVAAIGTIQARSAQSIGSLLQSGDQVKIELLYKQLDQQFKFSSETTQEFLRKAGYRGKFETYPILQAFADAAFLNKMQNSMLRELKLRDNFRVVKSYVSVQAHNSGSSATTADKGDASANRVVGLGGGFLVSIIAVGIFIPIFVVACIVCAPYLAYKYSTAKTPGDRPQFSFSPLGL